jgi:hypothetical protein
LSYEDIKCQLKEEDEDIIRVLYSIAYIESTKFYQRKTIAKTIATSDKFKFNPPFTHTLRKTKIPLTQVDEKDSSKVILLICTLRMKRLGGVGNVMNIKLYNKV